MKTIKCIYLAILLLTLCSCHGKSVVKSGELPIAVGSVSAEVLGQIKRDAIIVCDTIDLKNKECLIPSGVTLIFKNGLIKNGTIIGNNTKIKSRTACFHHVRISGTWNVPVISTDMFFDLSYNNALKDVIALSSPIIKNKILIGKGNYSVAAYKDGEACLEINSNTKLVVNGNISLAPNDLKKCFIINVSGNNIDISGNGKIKGDKYTHIGMSGEWGMGVNLSNAHHVKLYGLDISDCWGDCVYIGNNSSDIVIYRCKLDNGRRQGISITSADSVYIKNCVISNVYGTAPEYAIDIEPNKGQKVSNVQIKGITIKNCKGGIYLCGVASNAEIGDVSIRHCKIIGVSKTPIVLQKCDKVLVDNIHFVRCNSPEPVVKENAINSIVRKISVE